MVCLHALQVITILGIYVHAVVSRLVVFNTCQRLQMKLQALLLRNCGLKNIFVSKACVHIRFAVVSGVVLQSSLLALTVPLELALGGTLNLRVRHSYHRFRSGPVLLLAELCVSVALGVGSVPVGFVSLPILQVSRWSILCKIVRAWTSDELLRNVFELAAEQRENLIEIKLVNLNQSEFTDSLRQLSTNLVDSFVIILQNLSALGHVHLFDNLLLVVLCVLVVSGNQPEIVIKALEVAVDFLLVLNVVFVGDRFHLVKVVAEQTNQTHDLLLVIHQHLLLAVVVLDHLVAEVLVLGDSEKYFFLQALALAQKQVQLLFLDFFVMIFVDVLADFFDVLVEAFAHQSEAATIADPPKYFESLHPGYRFYSLAV